MSVCLIVVEWSPDPVIFQLGSISIKWYGLMYSVALMACYCLGYYFFKREKLPLHQLMNLTLLLFISGLIGARLGQIIFYEPQYFLNHPAEIFKIWKGGLASHGAFVGMVFTWFLYSKKNTQFNFWWGMDRLSIMGALTVCLMRVGNLMNSEILGKATSVNWAFIFTQRDLVPRHPVVLYEAIAYFLYFVLFLWIDYRYPKLKSGTLCFLFFMLLIPTRMLLENFKEDAGYTQILSLPLVLIGLGIGLFRLRSKL